MYKQQAVHPDLLSLIVPRLPTQDLLPFIFLGGSVHLLGTERLDYLLEKKYAMMYPVLYSVYQENKLTNFVEVIKNLQASIQYTRSQHFDTGERVEISNFLLQLVLDNSPTEGIKKYLAKLIDDIDINEIIYLYILKLIDLFQNKLKHTDYIYGVKNPLGSMIVDRKNKKYHWALTLTKSKRFESLHTLFTLYARINNTSTIPDGNIIESIEKSLKLKGLLFTTNSKFIY